MLPLLELALQEAPSDSEPPHPPRPALDDVEHSGVWLQLAKVEEAEAEAEALLSLFGLWECFT